VNDDPLMADTGQTLLDTKDYSQKLIEASSHLAAHDSKLAQIIAASPACDFAPHTDYYGALVNSIIGQQLSVKAAAAIKKRFRELFGSENYPSPEAILEKSTEDLRAVGLSFAKIKYIRDLAEHVLDGRLTFKNLAAQTNQEIITELTDVKGIGEWTVHMFLMFCVGRLDVLPTGDLGVRNAVRNIYGFQDAPSPAEVKEIAAKNSWHPYETVASWYLWRSLDNAPL
jgi:DNA-3-methyladenine glycosylase II